MDFALLFPGICLYEWLLAASEPKIEGQGG
jgi:hypothetical protein